MQTDECWCHTWPETLATLRPARMSSKVDLPAQAIAWVSCVALRNRKCIACCPARVCWHQTILLS